MFPTQLERTRRFKNVNDAKIWTSVIFSRTRGGPDLPGLLSGSDGWEFPKAPVQVPDTSGLSTQYSDLVRAHSVSGITRIKKAKKNRMVPRSPWEHSAKYNWWHQIDGTTSKIWIENFPEKNMIFPKKPDLL